MANKRMFSSAVTESDKFLDMPVSAQALYFHLCLYADDDGIIDCPRKIQRSVNCNDDDMKLLIAKGYIIVFDSGIAVIAHWHVHNVIRKDSYKPTVYCEEYSRLERMGNDIYALRAVPEISMIQVRDNSVTDTLQDCTNPVTDTVQNCTNSVTDAAQVCNETVSQYRLDKVRLDKDRSGEGKSAPARTFGEFKNILLSDDEYSDLIKEYGEKIIGEYIRRMDTYLHNNPKRKYNSHYTQLRLWLSEDKVKGATDYKTENAFNVSDPWGA